MPVTDEAPAAPAGSAAGGPPAPPSPRPARGLLRRARAPALELLALTAFVLARPVLGSFGRSPETFVARGADWTDVVVFGLVVVLAPVVVMMLAEVVVGLVAGERARRFAHLCLTAGLLAVVVWQLVEMVTDWDSSLGGPVSLAVGATVAAVLARVTSLASFVRYASIGALVFLVQFLALAPTSSIVFGGRHAAADIGPTGLGDEAPPVVLVVLDGLPTELLLDGEGQIDDELYPNLAALAGDATWYRNHTSVAQYTLAAVPAILSGTQPSAEAEPAVVSNHPGNIFTLLGGSHEIHGAETITGLCPVTVCPEPAGSPLGGLLQDAADMWEVQMSDTAVDPELVPYAFDDRYEKAEEWITAQDFGRGDRPGLRVLHLLLPHPGWQYLPDGSQYEAVSGQPAGMFADMWSGWGIDVAVQRHVLQAQTADRLLGELIDRIRADGAYDGSLIAVTADHGYAFTEGAPWRALNEDNYDEIMWTPLIVKAPGQREGSIDDSNVNSLDVLPTIAAELGIDELPWDADGRPAGSVDRDPADKWVVDWDWARLHADGDEEIVRVDGEEGFARVLEGDPVEGTGPLAVWRRTAYGGLVGDDVDALDVGAPADEAIRVRGLDRWDDVDTDRPPLELVATSRLPADTEVVITVDGVVAAVVPTVRGAYGVGVVHALLWPGAVDEGRNTIGAYLVDGAVDAPVLHEVDVENRAGG